MLVFFAYKQKGKGIKIDRALKTFAEDLDIAEFEGGKNQSLMLYPSLFGQGESFAAKRILLVGLGEVSGKIPNFELAEMLRLCGGIIAEKAKSCKAKSVGMKLPEFKGIEPDNSAEHLVEGVILGDYQFYRYKKEDKDKFPGIRRLTLFGAKEVKAVREAVARGENSGHATRSARDMANEPGNVWTAAMFAEHAEKLAVEYGLQCTVLEKTEMESLGMGGLLAVNRGSKEPPKFIIVDYCPPEYNDTVLLVGKGLTFDTGGISIKPAQNMMDMKYDMCGGAAALSAMQAVGAEKPAVRVVALIPSTDNMPGGGALKPGDVIRHYGGITSEIENTDAEGRLILADALAYGIEKYEPTCVIDLATLTGAVVIALGHHYTGMMSNSDSLAEKLAVAGRNCGEPVWRLPLGEEYVKQIKSEVADIKNSGGRPGGSITAAEYLHKFVGDTPWAHLDIAGTAWDFTEKAYIPKGPSGTGTRTLIDLIRNWGKGLQGDGKSE